MAGVRIVGTLPFPTSEEVERAAVAALGELGAIGASRVKEVLLTARDARGFVGRKDTGLAHSSVGASRPTAAGGVVRSVVGMGSPRDEISGVLEEGRRPGQRPPPSAALKPWARRKLRDAVASSMRGARVTTKDAAKFRALADRIAKSGGTVGRGMGPKVSGVGKAAIDKAADRLAFVVARSIGRKGFPGLHAFASAEKLVEGLIEETFARHLARVTEGGA